MMFLTLYSNNKNGILLSQVWSPKNYIDLKDIYVF